MTRKVAYMIVARNGEAGPYATKAEARAALRRGIADHGKAAMRGWRIKKVVANPHKSHARVSAKRSAVTIKIFNEVARVNKLARQAEKMGLSGVAKELGAKATRLLKRANESGGQERPVGRLPNPRKCKNPIRLTAADIARLPKKAQEQIKRELERDEAPIIRRPLRPANFLDMPPLSAMPRGASKVRLKSGQVISRVKALNPSNLLTAKEKTKAFQAYARKHGFFVDTVKTVTDLRRKAIVEWLTNRKDPRLANYKQNPGLIDIAGGLQAADYLEGRLFGKKKRNPSVSDLSKTFQGKASGAVSEFKASNSAPGDLARIGKLVFLKLKGGKQTRVPGAMVAVDTRGKLWLVGNCCPMFSRKAKPGQRLDWGEISDLCYLTSKKHIENGKLTEYVHPFGEEGGRKPHLQIDDEGMPIIRGGDYQIKSEGIVN